MGDVCREILLSPQIAGLAERLTFLISGLMRGISASMPDALSSASTKTAVGVLKNLHLAFSQALGSVTDSHGNARIILADGLEILNRLQGAMDLFEERVIYDIIKTDWKEGLQALFRQSRFELSVDQLDSCVSELKSHHLPEEPLHRIASLLRDTRESIDQIKSVLVGGGAKTPRGVRVPSLG